MSVTRWCWRNSPGPAPALPSSCPGHTSLATWPIFEYGTPAQIEKYGSGLASGNLLGAFALTEPAAGTDAAAGKTPAVLDGDEWVLNGSKIFITNGAHADVFIVTAMTDPSAGHPGDQRFHRRQGRARPVRRG